VPSDDDYDNNSGNASCVPVCYLKNIKTEIYRTIILPVVAYAYKTSA
jgi:hypothetical protein